MVRGDSSCDCHARAIRSFRRAGRECMQLHGEFGQRRYRDVGSRNHGAVSRAGGRDRGFSRGRHTGRSVEAASRDRSRARAPQHSRIAGGGQHCSKLNLPSGNDIGAAGRYVDLDYGTLGSALRTGWNSRTSDGEAGRDRKNYDG